MSNLLRSAQFRDPLRERETSPVVEVAARSRDVGRAGEDTEAVDAARAGAQRDPFAGIESTLIPRYLLALSALAREVADRPALLLPFLAILSKVPATLMELRRESLPGSRKGRKRQKKRSEKPGRNFQVFLPPIKPSPFHLASVASPRRGGAERFTTIR